MVGQFKNSKMTIVLLLTIASCLSLGIDFTSGMKFYRGRMLGGSQAEVRGSSPVSPSGIQEFYFSQVLDHFSPHDPRRWRQRYFMNNEFFRSPTGPVFLVIEGEGPSNPQKMFGAYEIANLARRVGARIFLVEHRYYGKSHPTGDASTANLKYLSSRQALMDLHAFQTEMKRIHRLSSNQWVTFGGSYAGSLAAWYRLKFPESAHAALAASAPVGIVADFPGYYQVVIASLAAKHSQNCVDAVHNATRSMRKLVEGGGTEWILLKRAFNMCEPLENTPQNIHNIFWTLADSVAGTVQYNEDHVTNPLDGIQNARIVDLCAVLTNDSTANRPSTGAMAAIERYANMYQFVNDHLSKLSSAATSTSSGTSANSCNDFSYANSMASLREDGWDSDMVAGGARQWAWQTCTEFGFFQTSTWHEGDIFGEFTPEFFLAQCRDIFGSKFDKAFVLRGISETQRFYGGTQAFENMAGVIFTNGKIDPWHAQGITNSSVTNPGNTVVFVPDGAHCVDLYPESPQDPPTLKFARKLIAKALVGSLKAPPANTALKVTP